MKNVFNIIAGPGKESCTILLYGEIGDYADVKASDFLTQIMDAERTYKHIDIRINSVGGQVSTGIAIFNALKASKAEITIYIDCLAASTASFIASCGRTVKMSRYARLMIHKPTGGVWGNADEIKDYMEQLTQIENTICDIYAQRTGLSLDEIRSTYMDGKDHWLDAEECAWGSRTKCMMTCRCPLRTPFPSRRDASSSRPSTARRSITNIKTRLKW